MKSFSVCILIAMVHMGGHVSAQEIRELNQSGFGLPIQQVAHTIDSGGGASVNDQFVNVATFGQGQPVGYASSTGQLNSAGFLHADSLSSSLVDDSDNDGILDWTELTGTWFDPLTVTSPFLADTDGDGQLDADERSAGTDPADPQHLLTITHVNTSNGQIVVRWVSREGKEYDLMCGVTVDDLQTNGAPVATTTAGAGVGPWKIATSTATATNTPARAFYRIKLKP